MPGDLTAVLAAVICPAFVTAAEPLLIPLLRRAAINIPSLPMQGLASLAIAGVLVGRIGLPPADGARAEARAMGLAA